MAIDESGYGVVLSAKRTKNICELATDTAKRGHLHTARSLKINALEELLGHGSYYTFRTRYKVIMKMASRIYLSVCNR